MPAMTSDDPPSSTSPMNFAFPAQCAYAAEATPRTTRETRTARSATGLDSGRRSGIRSPCQELARFCCFSTPEVSVEFALDALQRVVDRLHVALQQICDLLVALAVDIEAEHLGFEVRQRGVDMHLQRPDALSGDDQVGGVARASRQHATEASLALVIGHDRARQAHIVVERTVL